MGYKLELTHNSRDSRASREEAPQATVEGETPPRQPARGFAVARQRAFTVAWQRALTDARQGGFAVACTDIAVPLQKNQSGLEAEHSPHTERRMVAQQRMDR